ncbi:hypothetical protein [Wenzhouxiangella marina]|uniref:Uncharacterized protein n=1 Tax=Wenzhouxiangella marina TaxID=1579979 RepID=A0A0K0XUJ2_9GAMM|nr:hypothetical protein [Wenzhouxiangella marina]AKS41286.1 hypothetical protein WM2015_905 [Wenzhouxiangella marina]MBB6086964.1 hypothetical protein [Wenzhouxiangella marina]
MTNNRTEALRRIAELAREHQLSRKEINEVLPLDTSAASWVRPLLATLGGLFVLAGLLAGLHLIWDDLMPLARVVIVFGTGLCALVMAVAACIQIRFERAAAPLFLLAGIFQTSGLVVLFQEYETALPDEVVAMLISGALMIQFGALFAWLKRVDLLFLTLVFGSGLYMATCAQLDFDGEWIVFTLGLFGLLLSWGLERTAWRNLCPLAWVAYALCFGGGLFALVESHAVVDLLLIAAAAGLIQISVVVERRSLLGVSVLMLLVYLGYYTGEYFADTLGWPIALILFGAALLAASGYAIKLGQRMRKSGDP